MNDHVVVTYRPDEEAREIITRELGSVARVDFTAGRSASERIDLITAADAVLSRNFSPQEVGPADIAAMGRVRLIQILFAGVDKVPFESLPPGAAVAGNAGAYAEPIAEHVLAMALTLAKSLFRRHRRMAVGRFGRSGANRMLKGAICGIIGLGGNGKAIAELMGAVGMRVCGINRSGETDARVEFVGTPVDMKKILTQADVLVVTTPLTRETYDLIGEVELGWMKPDAMIINVGRGNVINEKALYDRLRACPDFGAGIDTWWSEPAADEPFQPAFPFLDLPNFIGSPHNADDVPGSIANATRLAADNVKRFLLGRPTRGLIDAKDYIP